MSDLNNGNYEYYEFRLNKNSFTKWNLNEGFNPVETTKLYNLNSLVITRASSLEHTDFACQMTNDGKMSPLAIDYNSTA